MGQHVHLPPRDLEGNGAPAPAPSATVTTWCPCGWQRHRHRCRDRICAMRRYSRHESARAPHLRRDPLQVIFEVPAASACALMLAPPRNAKPSSTPGSRMRSSRRPDTSTSRIGRRSAPPSIMIGSANHPSLQGLELRGQPLRGPGSAGINRPFAPSWQRHRITSTVYPRCDGSTLAWLRQAPISGSSSAQCAPASTMMPETYTVRAELGTIPRRK